MKSPIALSTLLLLSSVVHAQTATQPQTNPFITNKPSLTERRILIRTLPESAQGPLEKAILADDGPKVLELIRTQPDLVRYLGLRPDDGPMLRPTSPLLFAIDHNKLNVVRALLESGSDAKVGFLLGYVLNKQDESWRPLAELLIKHGAKINHTPPVGNGEPSLVSLLGVTFQSHEKWDFLLKHGANPLMRASTNNGEKQLLIDRASQQKASGALAAMMDFLPVDVKFDFHDGTSTVNGTMLHLAIRSRNRAAVKQLLARHPNLEVRDSHGMTPLILATDEVDDLAQLLLNAGAAPSQEALNNATIIASAKQKSGALSIKPLSWLALLFTRVLKTPSQSKKLSPLLCAIQTQNRDVLEVVLDFVQPTNDRERFFLATALGDVDTLKKLSRRNVHLISATLSSGQTPLHISSSWRTDHALRFLISLKANVNAADTEGRTPLHLAALLGNYEAVNLLCSRKPRVNAPDINGQTPLHYALYNTDTAHISRARRTVAALFKGSADANNEGIGRYSYRESAFSLAISCGDTEIVRLFLDNGVNIEKLTLNGTSPLAFAVERLKETEGNAKEQGAYLQIIKRLLERGANIKVKTSDGHPLLKTAICCEINDFEVPRLLLQRNANINERIEDCTGQRGATALSFVLDRPKSVQFALEHGAALNTKSWDDTPLLIWLCSAFVVASQAKDNTPVASVWTHRPTTDLLESARLLLKTGRMPLHAANPYGSPLEIAVDARSPEMVTLLLEFGADPNEKNAQGKTALDIARERGKTEIVERMEVALVSKKTP